MASEERGDALTGALRLGMAISFLSDLPYVPPKGATYSPKTSAAGSGFLDKSGDRWQWARQEVKHGGLPPRS